MSDGKIKLPRSSYEELCKIIIAYGQSDKPASLEQLSKATAMAQTIISGNNSFLATIELIEGGRKKIATTMGRSIAKALEHNIDDDIRTVWMSIVQQNEFLNKMVLSVKIRKGMDVSAFESHIAYSAGEAKNKAVMTGSRAVIDILKASRLIEERDGKIFPVGDGGFTTTSTTATTTTTPSLTYTTTTTPGPKLVAPHKEMQLNVSPGIVAINLNINITIDAKPSDIDDLGVKINDLLKDISQQTHSQGRGSDKE